MANRDHLIESEDELLGNWIPVENPTPIIPGRTVAAPPVNALIPSVPKFSQGSLPPSGQHDASFVAQAQGSSNHPEHSLMPLGLSGNSVTSAAITSVIKTSEKLVGNTLVLETNGLLNPNQNTLNLEAGSGVTLESDASGAVTISSAGGDGLTHGDPVWEYDSAYTIWRDDFEWGNLTSGQIGELGWATVGFQSPAGQVFMGGNQKGFPYIGNAMLVTANTGVANNGIAIIPTWSTNTSSFNTNHSFDGYLALLDNYHDDFD